MVDTSVWVEWIAGRWKPRALEAEMPEQEDCIVPTIVQLELSKWALREGGSEAADRVLGFTTRCDVRVLDTTIAVTAAELGTVHKLPLADSIIYATAISADAYLLTCDAHFEGLERVLYLPKPADT